MGTKKSNGISRGIAYYKSFVRKNLALVSAFNHSPHSLCGPELLHMDITNKCSLDCVGCWCRSPLLGDKSMPADELQKFISVEKAREIIEQASRMGTREVKLVGGGDPTNHPDFMEICELVKSKGMFLDINSNFTLVTKSVAKRLVDIGSDLWTTSIWAGTPQAYTATHPNQPEKTFLRLKEMLTYVSEYKRETKRGSPWIKIYNVISNKNYDDLVNMLSFAIEVGADDVQFVPLDPVEGRTECLLLDPSQRDKVIEQLEAIKRNYDPRIRAIVDDKGKVIIHMTALDEYEYRIRSQGMDKGVYDIERIKRVPCYTGYLFARVMGNGNVVPCCKGFRKPMGNINQKSFKAIWDGKKYQEFRVKGRSVFKNWDYFKDFDCHKTCDNLWQNEPMHERVKRLSGMERSVLTVAQKAYLLRRSIRRRLR